MLRAVSRKTLVGTPWLENGKLYNTVALLDGGRGKHKNKYVN